MLGAAWNIINPLATIIVYTVVFSAVMQARLPGIDDRFGYSIFLCAGVLPWLLFSEIVTRCQSMFVDNANLLKKSSFPRLCLPAIAVLTALGNFAIVFGLFLGFLALSRQIPRVVAVAAVPVLGLQVLFAAGLGVFAGVLNVFFRDVGQITATVLQFWFWLTPIAYPLSVLSPELRRWAEQNPLYGSTFALQSIFLNGHVPDWSSLSLLARSHGSHSRLWLWAVPAARRGNRGRTVSAIEANGLGKGV